MADIITNQNKKNQAEKYVGDKVINIQNFEKSFDS
jgi:hypothetical protein